MMVWDLLVINVIIKQHNSWQFMLGQNMKVYSMLVIHVINNIHTILLFIITFDTLSKTFLDAVASLALGHDYHSLTHSHTNLWNLGKWAKIKLEGQVSKTSKSVK